MNRVTPVLATLAAVMLVMPSMVQAQQAPKALKVGFVNVQRLLIESPQANAANRALENEFAPRQRDLQAKQKAFKDRADKFQKDGAVMGADERRNAENDLRRDERELQRQIEELREDLNNRKNEELGKLRINVLRQIEGFAKQGGYDLIVSDALYVSPALDVTSQVLQGLQSGSAPAKP
ncbi:MAG: OmpH family outer membrane protein [Chromatiales bacterium]|nr:OmpH family outer membrane protein [Chromatiales bacterium]